MIGFHGYYRDGAVVQRRAPVIVKGYAEGEVLCTLAGGAYRETRAVQARDGAFTAVFPAVEDTRSRFTLSATCGEETAAVFLRFGDVYLAAGQSNMSYVLSATEDWEAWLARAAAADVAVLNLTEPAVSSTEEVTRPVRPLGDLCREYAWTPGRDCSEVSAICVQTAALLSEKNKVPVGVVQTAMGGLSVESYLKRESVEADEALVSFLKEAGRYQPENAYNCAGERNFTQVAGLWNEKIAPLTGFSFAGIFWYLGESSAWDYPFAEQFGKMMCMLLRDYRAAFGEIPFAAIHIAPEYYPYGDRYGYLYVNEVLTDLQRIPGVFALPIYDIEPRWMRADGALYYHPIHPVNKAPISVRLAEAFSGGRARWPEIASVSFAEGKAVCRIAHAGPGMRAGPYRGFTLAGKDGKYYPARAVSAGGDTIEVTSEDAAEPAFLTYAFTQYQDFCDAASADGAPLLPYRTERGAVEERYCFPPAFLTPGADKVRENCFGWQVGTCRKADVWKKGEIYDASEVAVTVRGDAVILRAVPDPKQYLLFGVSPAICLSGHNHHIADYRYWNFTLSADGTAEFLGVVARAAGGEVFRFDLLNGEEKTDCIPLEPGERRSVSVSLERGARGDSAAVTFTRGERKSFVQAEFLFRARLPVTVRLEGLTVSDVSRSERGREAARESLRGDIALPDQK